MSKKGRYNEAESKVGADKRIRGEIPNEGKPWTHVQLDTALTLWLNGAAKDTICKATGRSMKSINTFVPSKLCNPDKHLGGYFPRYQDAPRSGRVYWTKRDDDMLSLCLKNGLSVNQIAALLARTPTTVQGRIFKLQSRGMPKLSDKKVGPRQQTIDPQDV